MRIEGQASDGKRDYEVILDDDTGELIIKNAIDKLTMSNLRSGAELNIDLTVFNCRDAIVLKEN